MILLTVTAVLFTLTSGLMVHAADNYGYAYGKEKKRDSLFAKKDWNEAQKKESSFLTFENKTKYDVTVFANVRKKGEAKYSTTLVELGSVAAGATTNVFQGLNNGFIGRKDTKYSIKVTGNTEGAPAINATPSNKDELEFKGKNKSQHLKYAKVEKAERDTVEMLLEVIQEKDMGIDMILSPVGNQ